MSSSNKSKKILIFSVRKKWASLIEAGEKSVEFRKRFSVFVPGQETYVVLYVTRPQKSIIGMCGIKKIEADFPENIWNRYGNLSCVSETEFALYAARSRYLCAVELTRLIKFPKPLHLDHLRATLNFRPPISWRWASETEEQFFWSALL